MSDRTAIPPPAHAPGETVHGFRIDSVTRLPDIRALAYEATHLKTGARLVHLHCHDPENLFSIGFRTPAPDATGIAHVLEHCVCCAGTKRFPVKDALGKGGVGMTWSDHTAYFTDSQLAKGLFNNARVLVEQVFYPLLAHQTFQREAHHLKLIDPDDPGDGLKISGVVYNEMRSSFDRPESYLLSQVRWHLSPDRPEAVDLGGDPACIPDLRNEDVVAFHRRYYRPSNARVLLYGDIPLAENLAFLDSAFAPVEREGMESGCPLQPAWPEPRRIELPYPSEAGNDAAIGSYVMLAWLLCPSSDMREMYTLAIALQALVCDRSAPLREILLDSGLGTSLYPSSRSIRMRIPGRGTTSRPGWASVCAAPILRPPSRSSH